MLSSRTGDFLMSAFDWPSWRGEQTPQGDAGSKSPAEKLSSKAASGDQSAATAKDRSRTGAGTPKKFLPKKDTAQKESAKRTYMQNPQAGDSVNDGSPRGPSPGSSRQGSVVLSNPGVAKAHGTTSRQSSIFDGITASLPPSRHSPPMSTRIQEPPPLTMMPLGLQRLTSFPCSTPSVPSPTATGPQSTPLMGFKHLQVQPALMQPQLPPASQQSLRPHMSRSLQVPPGGQPLQPQTPFSQQSLQAPVGQPPALQPLQSQQLPPPWASGHSLLPQSPASQPLLQPPPFHPSAMQQPHSLHSPFQMNRTQSQHNLGVTPAHTPPVPRTSCTPPAPMQAMGPPQIPRSVRQISPSRRRLSGSLTAPPGQRYPSPLPSGLLTAAAAAAPPR
mmetsp:Transcript_59193/g.114238  ORF Transcript_59193/g.114238 Transcript_59193/m.114238 type:complete len:388 (+) Transcript_59193:43-1206(+)